MMKGEMKIQEAIKENILICSVHKKRIIYKCRIENTLGCVSCAKNYKYDDENIIDFDEISMISHFAELQ